MTVSKRTSVCWFILGSRPTITPGWKCVVASSSPGEHAVLGLKPRPLTLKHVLQPFENLPYPQTVSRHLPMTLPPTSHSIPTQPGSAPYSSPYHAHLTPPTPTTRPHSYTLITPFYNPGPAWSCSTARTPIPPSNAQIAPGHASSPSAAAVQ